MKIRFLIITLLLTLGFNAVQADVARDKVETGIANVERMIDAHKWKEAFVKLREVETSSATTDALRYLTAKERYRMYTRLNKPAEIRDCMEKMETLAMRSADETTIEDMLMTKASYYSKLGNIRVQNDCYQEIFNRRVKGKDDMGQEECFQKMIEEAKKKGNKSMQSVITELYTSWQDSLSAIRAAEEIMQLKDSCSNALTLMEEKDSKIGWQRGTIVVLTILLVAVAVALVLAILLVIRKISTTNKLRNKLKISETNSEQKSFFMRNIAKQISPSLSQIAAGNTRPHVASLERMLADVETFMDAESCKEEKLELENSQVGQLCEQVAKDFTDKGKVVTSDAPKLSFPVNVEAVTQVLKAVIGEMLSDSQTERIVVGFKKRNPHTGQFTITAIGMRIPEEDRESLFVPFAKVYDLTQTTGLVLPICSLVAQKMDGSLSLDDSFAKGTRFVLEVHS